MSENETNDQQQAPAQQMAIQRVYLKDVSFETPNSPAIFTGQWDPQVGIELNSSAKALDDNGNFEVVITVTVTCKVGEKTAYLAEVQQAGIFAITGFDQAQLSHLLGAYCPNVLFPYAREVVSSLVNNGSFPQMLLAPINFDALYAQHLAQKAQQAQQAAASTH